MIPCISVENMRKSDAYTITDFVPSLTLMHRAAMGVYKATSWDGCTAIVVGSGNNGGDGFALACILKKAGYHCTVFTLSNRLSGDSAHYAVEAEALGVSVQSYEPGCLRGFERVVDCLLGTGFQGTVRENYRQAIDEINSSQAFVISVDINSGMNGDTGEAEIAVRSDLTVTIGYVKHGLVTENAGEYMKRLVCTDIGILLTEEERWIVSKNDALPDDPKFLLCPEWLDMTIIESK